MAHEKKTLMEQILEIDGLQLNLREIEETLLAIRSGEVDALVIRGGQGEQVRAFQGADHPFRALIDTMNEGAVLLDLAGSILYSNRRFAGMVGKDAAELVGLGILSFLSPGIAGAASDLAGPAGGGEAPRREITLLRPDGNPVEVRITVSRFHVDGVTLLCLVATDLADERKAEKTAAAERRAAFLARAGALLVGSLDYEATVENIARISVPILGDWCWVHLLEEGGSVRRLAFSQANPENAGSAEPVVVPDSSTLDHAPLLHEVLAGGETAFYPEVGSAFFDRFATNPELASALRRLQLRSVMTLPLAAHGRILGALTFAKGRPGSSYAPEDLDLARELASRVALAVDNARLHRLARRANEELERRVEDRTRELRESVRELEAFTYTVAHDLRAPLRAIAGCSEILLEESGDLFAARADLRDYFVRITQGATKMDALINDLLSFSRLGRTPLELDVVPLEAAVLEARDHFDEELARSGGRIHVETPMPRVRAHRPTLDQVLSNLLSNALKFVAPGVRPEVRVAAEEVGGMVRLSVGDNGIGIDPRFQDRIFGVFERLNQSERYPGTGIGLAIVRRAIERMGGRCGVDSELGKGACFWFELPGDAATLKASPTN